MWVYNNKNLMGSHSNLPIYSLYIILLPYILQNTCSLSLLAISRLTLSLLFKATLLEVKKIAPTPILLPTCHAHTPCGYPPPQRRDEVGTWYVPLFDFTLSHLTSICHGWVTIWVGMPWTFGMDFHQMNCIIMYTFLWTSFFKVKIYP